MYYFSLVYILFLLCQKKNGPFDPFFDLHMVHYSTKTPSCTEGVFGGTMQQTGLVLLVHIETTIAGTSGDETSDDDVLLEPTQAVFLASDSSVDEDTCGLHKGRC